MLLLKDTKKCSFCINRENERRRKPCSQLPCTHTQRHSSSLRRRVLQLVLSEQGHTCGHQRALRYSNSPAADTQDLEAPKMFDWQALGSNRRGVKRVQDTKEGFFLMYYLCWSQRAEWAPCTPLFLHSAQNCADKYLHRTSRSLWQAWARGPRAPWFYLRTGGDVVNALMHPEANYSLINARSHILLTMWTHKSLMGSLILCLWGFCVCLFN